MAGLRAAWESEYGPGSVIGLAPSAVAAQVLGDELGIETENTAKWLFEWRRLPEMSALRERLALNLARNAYPGSPVRPSSAPGLLATDHAIASRRLKPGQLVIVDEATLAGTLRPRRDRPRRGRSRIEGLVGRRLGPAWSSSRPAGRSRFSSKTVAISSRSSPRSDAFNSEWEKAASTELRLGKQAAIDYYEDHGRIREGDRETMLDAVYAAWKKDIDAGKSSLMIAGDSATVTELNAGQGPTG